MQLFRNCKKNNNIHLFSIRDNNLIENKFILIKKKYYRGKKTEGGFGNL